MRVVRSLCARRRRARRSRVPSRRGDATPLSAAAARARAPRRRSAAERARESAPREMVRGPLRARGARSKTGPRFFCLAAPYADKSRRCEKVNRPTCGAPARRRPRVRARGPARAGPNPAAVPRRATARAAVEGPSTTPTQRGIHGHCSTCVAHPDRGPRVGGAGACGAAGPSAFDRPGTGPVVGQTLTPRPRAGRGDARQRADGRAAARRARPRGTAIHIRAVRSLRPPSGCASDYVVRRCR